MVVLQVLPSLMSGGVERGTVEITQAIVEAGGTALVASAGGRLVHAIHEAGGRHIVLPLATKDPLRILLNARWLARVIRAEGAQIVHARSRAPAWSALLAARRTGARLVTTYHGAYSEGLPFKRRYNAVMASGDRVIAISRFIAQLIETRHELDPARLRVIPRGVDAALFDPAAVSGERMARLAAAWRLSKGQRVVLLPGRLSRWKGHAVLLEALGSLRRSDVCCVLMGEAGRNGAYARSLVRLAERLGLAERVRLAGVVEDVPAALSLADVVIHAATAPEAFGRVVIEAQAMERPVIAADGGGPAETVQQGVTGWRVPPGDSRALALALAHVLDMTNEERRAVGARARAAVLARYTTRAMQGATLAVYRELLP